MSYYISHPETRAGPQSLSHCSTTAKSRGFVQPREKIGQILFHGHVDASTQRQAEGERPRERETASLGSLAATSSQQDPSTQPQVSGLKLTESEGLCNWESGSDLLTPYQARKEEWWEKFRLLLPFKVTAVGQETYLKAFLLSDQLYSLITRWNKSQF